MSRRKRKSVGKGVISGLIGGLVASWAMSEFQAGWTAAKKLAKNGNSGAEEQNPQKQSANSEDATMKAAGRISKALFGQSLSKKQKQQAGPIVHYAFGSAMGGFYGALAEELPAARMGLGLPFGAALFVGADEIAVPAFGLSSQSPLETPVADHVYALASHFVYGAVTELVRRGVRATLN